MLSIAHAAAGAYIATAVPDPVYSIPLILASHFLLDAVPHWDVGTGMGRGLKSPRSALIQEIPDLLLAAAIIFLLFPSSLPHVISPMSSMRFTLPLGFTNIGIANITPIWGAFFGLLPDFLEAPRNFLKVEPWFLRPINRFHHWFHHSIPYPAAGLAPQLLLLVAIWLLK